MSGRGESGKKNAAMPKVKEEKNDGSESKRYDAKEAPLKSSTPMKKSILKNPRKPELIDDIMEKMAKNTDNKSLEKKVESKSTTMGTGESKPGASAGNVFKIPKANQTKPILIDPPYMPSMMSSKMETVDLSGNDDNERQKYSNVAAERGNGKRSSEAEEQVKYLTAQLAEAKQKIKNAEVRMSFVDDQLKSVSDYKTGISKILGEIGPLSCNRMTLEYLIDGKRWEELLKLVSERRAEGEKGSKTSEDSFNHKHQQMKSVITELAKDLNKALNSLNDIANAPDAITNANTGGQHQTFNEYKDTVHEQDRAKDANRSQVWVKQGAISDVNTGGQHQPFNQHGHGEQSGQSQPSVVQGAVYGTNTSGQHQTFNEYNRGEITGRSEAPVAPPAGNNAPRERYKSSRWDQTSLSQQFQGSQAEPRNLMSLDTHSFASSQPYQRGQSQRRAFGNIRSFVTARGGNGGSRRPSGGSRPYSRGGRGFGRGYGYDQDGRNAYDGGQGEKRNAFDVNNGYSDNGSGDSYNKRPRTSYHDLDADDVGQGEYSTEYK